MHTIIRHTKTDSGFACVITGYGKQDSCVQEYDTSNKEGDSYTTLVSEHRFADERDAIKHFDWIFFNNEPEQKL